jgi:hypothetical protein
VPALLSDGVPDRRWCGGLGCPLGAPPLRHWTEASVVQLGGLSSGSRRWAAVGRPMGGGGAAHEWVDAVQLMGGWRQAGRWVVVMRLRCGS